jgi:hypothetical protein
MKWRGPWQSKLNQCGPSPVVGHPHNSLVMCCYHLVSVQTPSWKSFQWPCELVGCWKSKQIFDNIFCELLVSESFLVWVLVIWRKCILPFHLEFVNMLFTLTDIFHHVYRCAILVKIWLHFQTSACLIWAACEILIWTRAHVSCSDSESEFNDPILIDTNDDDDDDAECIFSCGLFFEGMWGDVGPMHTVHTDCAGNSDNVNFICDIRLND